MSQQRSPRKHYEKLSELIGNIRTAMDELVLLGRPGLWILHQEDLYFPSFDTRPHSRDFETEVRVSWPPCHGVTVRDRGLTWAGRGLEPNFDDYKYWARKQANLYTKVRKVMAGRVQPRFTPEELRTLEAFEADERHPFAIALKCRKQREEIEAWEAARAPLFAQARERVIDVMRRLWRHGLAGQWALQGEPLYLPEYDISDRMQWVDDSDGRYMPDNVVVDDKTGLRYYTVIEYSMPCPNSLEFWEERYAALLEKEQAVRAGRLTEHKFTAAERERIERLEQAINASQANGRAGTA